MIKPNGVRPYWHVDAKWISGILLFIFICISLVLTVFFRLTQESRAIEYGAIIMASAFSRNGLDSPEDLTPLKQQIASSPSKAVAPLPGFSSVVVTEQDLNLSPRELRLKVFRQISTPIYQKGVTGAAKDFSKDPALQKKFEKDATFLTLMTRQTHKNISRMLVISVIAALILMTIFVYFSWGWGRLGNPGLLLLTTGLPGTLFGLILNNPPPEGNRNALGFLPSEIVSQIGAHIGQTSAPVLIIGLTLLIAAAIGRVATRRRLPV